VSRSVGLTLARCADRVEVHVHGSCIGAGIEIPAFSHRVVAKRDASFSLPEVGFGLIPGAGGTASLPRRIGRHRTAYAALSGEKIDALRAHEWGLVDQLVE
jgi:enoyl-CoA hydratase